MALANRSRTRVLVVDDSAFMRKVITDILSSAENMEVVDTAKNGLEALQKVKLLKPDVVTLDVEMPVMDGLSCLVEILKTGFTPVVMLSSLTRSGADETIKALELGAIDFIAKPSNVFDLKGGDKGLEIVEKVATAAGAQKPRHSVPIRETRQKMTVQKSAAYHKVVAIGTSTGGPKALHQVIPMIPGDIPAAFLIVQHMPPGFTKSLASSLNADSELSVKEAENGDTVLPGYAYIAPGDYHMMVDMELGGQLKIRLTKDPPIGGLRPAADIMMGSLSDTGLQNLVGVIMTGMGGDGSEGIKKIKDRNKGYIISQDEKTCVVYGMPKMAVQTGAVDVVVPLGEIAGEIVKIVGVHK